MEFPCCFLYTVRGQRKVSANTEMIVPLSHNIGGIITLNGIIFLVKGFLPFFSNHWFVYAIIAWMILAGLDVWYIEKSNRYRRP
ncbi:MAG TPA: DUF3784 domain-containing protein [Candidatus Blautia stercoravium]|nr:DUF3784 domain-containing protein [Candidatus Blautia stercoravium]